MLTTIGENNRSDRRGGVRWQRLAIDVSGAVVIGIGVAAAVAGLTVELMPPGGMECTGVRLTLARCRRSRSSLS